ncbi:MAG: replication initiator protein [Microviridae sp.]|nr:MAG: replication initiator protein [Microviridae sp.]
MALCSFIGKMYPLTLCAAASVYDMPCYSPLQGYKSKYATANGKHKITFNRAHGFVDIPMSVPCGQCIGCRIDKSREWAIRCVHEAKMHQSNCFLTLTYDDEHLLAGHTLVKEHLQKFLKRLRHHYGSFRFFACGEYGDETKRPHYHAIIFGLDFHEDRKKHSTNGRGDILFKCDKLQEIWGHGHILIGSFNYASAAYTARYCMKKQTGKDSHNHAQYHRIDPTTGEIIQVNPEFACMSLRPGIGSAWYEKYKADAFPSDFLVHAGKQHPVPRYYSDKLKKEDETTYKKIKLKRLKFRDEHKENSTPDRLYTREECKAAQINTLKRKI